jgi:hypothetical protein
MKLKECKECMKDVVKLDVEISLETAKIIYDNLTQKTYADKSMDKLCELFLFAVYLKKLINKKETENFNENGKDVIKIIKAHNQTLIDRMRC